MNSTSKIAVITGAGSGIGKSVAFALLREGYSIVLGLFDSHLNAQDTIDAAVLPGRIAPHKSSK